MICLRKKTTKENNPTGFRAVAPHNLPRLWMEWATLRPAGAQDLQELPCAMRVGLLQRYQPLKVTGAGTGSEIAVVLVTI